MKNIKWTVITLLQKRVSNPVEETMMKVSWFKYVPTYAIGERLKYFLFHVFSTKILCNIFIGKCPSLSFTLRLSKYATSFIFAFLFYLIPFPSKDRHEWYWFSVDTIHTYPYFFHLFFLSHKLFIPLWKIKSVSVLTKIYWLGA